MKNDFDNRLKAALEYGCAGFSAPTALKCRIDSEIDGHRAGSENAYGSGERSIFMKNKERKNAGTGGFRLSGKKMLILIAATCCLVSGAVFAGNTSYFATSVKAGSRYDSFEELAKAQEVLGYSADAVESFSQGYKFKDGRLSYTDARDEDDNVIYTFPELWVHYEKAGEPGLSLVVEKPVEKYTESKQPDLIRQHGSIELHYNRYTYKFVPPDYELTKEDKANMERDDYYISVGSEQVEIRFSTGVTWEKDGIHYNLFGFDLNLSGEEMLDMAEEILAADSSMDAAAGDLK